MELVWANGAAKSNDKKVNIRNRWPIYCVVDPISTGIGSLMHRAADPGQLRV